MAATIGPERAALMRQAARLFEEAGTHDKLFCAPTVLGGVTTKMPAVREEIFGPVAPVIVVKDDAEAVANDTEYGLVAAIQTGSAERVRAIRRNRGVRQRLPVRVAEQLG